MFDVRQELMTPPEAAKWFRRSPSWLRQQPELLRVQGVGGQPLYHVNICRAYVLGRLCRLSGRPLRRLQIRALVLSCGLAGSPGRAARAPAREIERLLLTAGSAQQSTAKVT